MERINSRDLLIASVSVRTTIPLFTGKVQEAIGTQRSYEIVERISQGQGKLEELDTLLDLASEMERASNCGLGQTATVPIRDMLKHFRTEVETHIRSGSCPTGVCEMTKEAEKV